MVLLIVLILVHKLLYQLLYERANFICSFLSHFLGLLVILINAVICVIKCAAGHDIVESESNGNDVELGPCQAVFDYFPYAVDICSALTLLC